MGTDGRNYHRVAEHGRFCCRYAPLGHDVFVKRGAANEKSRECGRIHDAGGRYGVALIGGRKGGLQVSKDARSSADRPMSRVKRGRGI